jgi:hypothetical protein
VNQNDAVINHEFSWKGAGARNISFGAKKNGEEKSRALTNDVNFGE